MLPSPVIGLNGANTIERLRSFSYNNPLTSISALIQKQFNALNHLLTTGNNSRTCNLQPRNLQRTNQDKKERHKPATCRRPSGPCIDQTTNTHLKGRHTKPPNATTHLNPWLFVTTPSYPGQHPHQPSPSHPVKHHREPDPAPTAPSGS